MIEERDANPTADTPGRFRGRRAPTALTAGGTESSEVVARLSGTESSNPLPSSGESDANLTTCSLQDVERAIRRNDFRATRRPADVNEVALKVEGVVNRTVHKRAAAPLEDLAAGYRKVAA
jgi:hypothetical protein